MAKRPFPLEKPKTHPWAGLKAPDPLREPDHPHSKFPGGHKNRFADGGKIGAPHEVLTDDIN